MLEAVMRHEWARLRATGTLNRLLLVLLTLVAMAAGAGRSRVASWRVEVAAARQEARETRRRHREGLQRLEAQGRPLRLRDPRNPAYVGGPLGRRFVTWDPGPLAWIATGHSKLHAPALAVSTEDWPRGSPSPGWENPTSLAIGGVDLAFVVVYLLPLLVLALSYDLLSGEREEGTLPMLVARSLPLGILVLGKLLVRLLVLGGGTLVLAVLALEPERVALADLPSLLLLGLVVLAYLGFWGALAAAVDAGGAGPARNAVVLACFWLALVLVLPALGNTWIESALPAPSRLELLQLRRQAAARAEREGATDLAEFYQDHPELAAGEGGATIDEYFLRKLLLLEAVEEAVAPREEAFRQALLEQQAQVRKLALLSPAVLTQEILVDLAGTSPEDHRGFVDRARSFHRRWYAFFRPRIMRREPLTLADLDAAPRPGEEEGQASTGGPGGLAGAVRGLALLLLPSGVLGWVTRRRLESYPVRDPGDAG